jgi:hypothetical protein
MLRGAIGSGRTDPAILERYGQLLDSVEDCVEAGKYLFLSGVRRQEYERSIGLFLKRHSRGNPRSLVAQFPSRIRQRPFGGLPSAVIAELTSLGVTPSMFAPVKMRSVSQFGRWERATIGAVVCGVLIAFVIGVFIGVRAIVVWLRVLFG